MMLQEAERIQEQSADRHCRSISVEGCEERAPGHKVAPCIHCFSFLDDSVPQTKNRQRDGRRRGGTSTRARN